MWEEVWKKFRIEWIIGSWRIRFAELANELNVWDRKALFVNFSFKSISQKQLFIKKKKITIILGNKERG